MQHALPPIPQKSAEWMGHSVSKLLGRIKSRVFNADCALQMKAKSGLNLQEE
jgi:hypothetical protein